MLELIHSIPKVLIDECATYCYVLNLLRICMNKLKILLVKS